MDLLQSLRTDWVMDWKCLHFEMVLTKIKAALHSKISEKGNFRHYHISILFLLFYSLVGRIGHRLLTGSGVCMDARVSTCYIIHFELNASAQLSNCDLTFHEILKRQRN